MDLLRRVIEALWPNSQMFSTQEQLLNLPKVQIIVPEPCEYPISRTDSPTPDDKPC